MDIKKLLVIFSFLIFLLISPSFAHDNNVTDSQISANYGDVYFNSSSLSDGDGSIENPYNKITMDRINNYATLHLADGEYNISGFKTISSLNIVGESYDNTIIRHDGLLFTVLSELSLNNLTLSGVTIKNQGIVNSTNVIFSDAAGSSSDRYNNVFGGVFDNYGTNYVKPKLYLDNCIFKNNHAEYGGAIYLINGEAFINNCLFEKNIAYNYGGAIACDGSSKLTIKNTRFKFDSSTNDAGGALYLKNSSIIIENSNFTNCNSLFGGAICDLNSDLSIDNAVFSSNGAVYDGGAIFKMYGDLSVLNSKFNFNAANNGGAIFADNSSSFVVKSSRFSSNTAKYCGGVIYSLLNKNSVIESNIYTRNKANSYPNVFETDLVNLFIGNNNYSMFKYNPSVNELPSKYSSVDEGYVTPIKDQQTSGNCWAFTAISTLESCILKASNITYDLSEENLKNIIELYSDYGWNMVTNGGGYDNMAIGYFASWLGPILEENDSFDDYSTLSPVLDSIMHVQNVIFLGRDNFTDNNRIKEAIFKYGAVGTGLYYSGSYLFGDSYYYSGSASENHAVTIVGWDDDYPYYKFRNPAPANGAWIVKNSWDDEWGDKGYFYVSYYDSRFAKVGNAISSYTFVLNDTLRYDKNYQYDIIGLTKFISSENEIWYKNIFNSTDDEVLSAFSTYFASKSNWTSYIYVNDELLLIQNGTSLPGYYTFDFNDYIYLNKGDSFKIVVKLENDGFINVPVSERTYSNKIFYKEGVSFFSYDGVEWYDLYNFAGSQVACMKAFTIIPSILLEINVIDEYNVNDLFNITSIISDNSLNGSVIYNIDGNLFTVNVTNGFANLPMSFNKSGIYDCSAYFVGEGKFSNKVDFF
ncbi:C1 family peptidase [uncultured Methanobrevibacter sp.]|uniref:C1 family peptidase n=1 Tax=uncultured Methanobrevibacter sp. TaxID=253161 RepID=UPI0025E268F8|nr:C1 family peptidase [uncultured Methanobrevibacter sp.]